jgi:hypothetical protein
MSEILAIVHAVVSQITVAVQTPVTYIIDIDVDKQFQYKICIFLECSIQLNILSLILDILSLILSNLATCNY